MYGEPLQPNRCLFDIGVFNGLISIFIEDLDESNNDDVRDVVHPDFDRYWGNDCENMFSTRHFKTMQEAKEWCVSIGMEFKGFTDNTESEDMTKVLSKYGRHSTQELNKMLNKEISRENYEKAAEINNEIKSRNA